MNLERYKMNKKESKSIEIPAKLFEKIEERAKNTGFKSASDYIVFVLKEVVSNLEEEPESLSTEDEEKVKERLRALGYL